MSERRIAARLLCADLVDVTWALKSGRKRRVTVSLDDISESGACIQLEQPLAIGTRMSVVFPKGEMTGSVRYCVLRELGYFIGIEFDLDCQWSPEDYLPQHLLDPRDMEPRDGSEKV